DAGRQAPGAPLRRTGDAAHEIGEDVVARQTRAPAVARIVDGDRHAVAADRPVERDLLGRADAVDGAVVADLEVAELQPDAVDLRIAVGGDAAAGRRGRDRDGIGYS